MKKLLVCFLCLLLIGCLPVLADGVSTATKEGIFARTALDTSDFWLVIIVACAVLVAAAIAVAAWLVHKRK